VGDVMMDTFLWWSGVAMWAALSFVGILQAIDWGFTFLARQFGFHAHLMAFIADRIRRSNP
jgi:hypothetical protein